MTTSLLVQKLISRLERAQYIKLPSPFQVASVSFDFAAVLRGSGARALDLVIVVDAATGSADDQDGNIVRNRVEALSRALDITGSRYTLSLILIGASLSENVRALTEICRVLKLPGAVLDSFDPDDFEPIAELDDYIRILLPLQLPAVEEQITSDGLPSTLKLLLKELPDMTDPVLLQDLIKGSYRGDQGVRSALGKRIDSVLGAPVSK